MYELGLSIDTIPIRNLKFLASIMRMIVLCVASVPVALFVM